MSTIGAVDGAVDSFARTEFDAFFRRHHRELGRLAFTMTGNREDADDVVGESFASVWEHWARVQAADHPLSYVRRIVVNLSINRVKRVIRERQGAALLGPIVRWFAPAQDVEVALDLQAAVLALPPGRRACVVLRHVFDLSEAEVSQTLGISLGTVKSQTSKGLAQLRGTLADRPDPAALRNWPAADTPPDRPPHVLREEDRDAR
jgi:RNA polymerase sigma-70 factor (sigma-E family)